MISRKLEAYARKLEAYARKLEAYARKLEAYATEKSDSYFSNGAKAGPRLINTTNI